MAVQPEKLDQEPKSSLKVWLINPYVNLPGEQWRLGRSSLLAYELARRGHDVLLWTGNISHRSKTIRTKDQTDQVVNDGFRIRLIPSIAYKKNIGFGRLAYEADLARKTYKQALKEPPPDVIVAHDPPQVSGHCGYLLSKRFGVPLITDTVDLWPEFWILALPAKLKGIGGAVFAPFYWWRRRNWRQASGYTSLAGPYLDLVCDEVDPERSKPTAVAYNGIDVAEFRQLMEGEPSVPLPDKEPGTVRAVFAGTLGPSYDLPGIIEAAQLAAKEGKSIEFAIAGDGPLRSHVEAAVKACPNLIYVGKLAPGDLAKLYARCDVGLCSYGKSSNVEMPDKVYDYTAAGLPVVNSLTGEVARVIRDQQIGRSYEAGSGRSLLDAIEAIYASPDAAAETARRSYEAALEFDNSVQINKYADLVEAVTCKSC